MTDPFQKIHWLNSTELPTGFFGHKIRFGFQGVGFKFHQSFHRVRQVHGNRIVTASDQTRGSNTEWPDGDGIFTNEPETIIAIKTADCLPVILADTEGRAIYAVHAGWRGLAAGIVDKALGELLAQGVPVRDVRVAIGPSITLPNYEVGPEVVAAFDHWDYCTYKAAGDRWHIDIAGIAAQKLLKLGLAPEHLCVVRSCTFANPQLWNSYRREGKVIASNWSWCEILR